jgi:hypothetical protein
MSKKKRLAYIVAGFLYGLLLVVLGFFPSGGDRGTYIFISLAAFPYGLGLLFWPAEAYLAADSESAFSNNLLIAVLLTHYVVLYLYLQSSWAAELPRIELSYDSAPETMLLPLVMLIAWQVFVWVAIVRGLILRRTPKA